MKTATQAPILITPTVGRVVWFYPDANSAEAPFARHPEGKGPYAALIVHVWSDEMVNLCVLDAVGTPHPRTSVHLVHEDDGGWAAPYCTWMPFQKGQAKAQDAAARVVALPVVDAMRPTAEDIERKARACHEINRAYCAGLGDMSQVTWEDAPEWQKESARKGVVVALNGATPEQLHESWMAVKRAEGWTYGPVKDPDAKQHPCFVPYAELPQAQRIKDFLFRAAVSL